MQIKLASLALAAILVSGCHNSRYDSKHRADCAAHLGTAEEIAAANHVYFGFDQHNLNADAAARTKQQAAWLAANPEAKVVIEGHTDPRGTREYNLALGDKRGNAVRNSLVEHGIDAHRTHVVSYGKDNAPADAKTNAEKRVAITKVQ